MNPAIETTPTVSNSPWVPPARPTSMARLRVLHLEDNRMDAEVIRTFMAAEFPESKITQVATRFAFLGELQLRPFDMIVSDFTMDAFNGLEALELARARAPHVPFVFYSGTLGDERTSEALQQGARDCVPKGQLKRLSVAIRRIIEEIEEHRRLEAVENQNRELERALLEARLVHQKLEDTAGNVHRLENVNVLAATVAHDLNNLLSPLMMAVALLRDSTPGTEERKLLDTLEKSAKRGATMVGQILTIVHGGNDRNGGMNLESLIQANTRFMAECFPKNIRVEESIPAPLWTVNAISSQIAQLLLNLCIIARNAMPAGGTLSIAAENWRIDETAARTIDGAYPGSFVQLRIEDTGSGALPDAVRKVVEARIAKGTQHNPEQAFAAVRNIVKQHAGFMEVKTVESRGSSVRVYLPATETPAKPSK